MAFREIGSAETSYLAATDILIGDMSNINYEYLLYDRPVVLLANAWVREFFPDIGLKCNLDGLEAAINRSIREPEAFSDTRARWLNLTIDQQNGVSASRRYIDLMLEASGVLSPRFVLLHGNDSVRITNLAPLESELNRRGIPYEMVSSFHEAGRQVDETIYVAAHFIDLSPTLSGFQVHIDHDLKGRATANLSVALKDYRKHDFFPHIDLHIAPGEAGARRTRHVVGPYSDRVVVGGYPKADDLLRQNTSANREQVFKTLGLETDKPLVTYAPAGPREYMKPGGSLSQSVVDHLEAISADADFHILVKRKYDAGGRQSLKDRFKAYCKRGISAGKLAILNDCGPLWDDLYRDVAGASDLASNTEEHTE